MSARHTRSSSPLVVATVVALTGCAGEAATPTPGGQGDDRVFSALRSRELEMPVLSPGAQCPPSSAIEIRGIPAEAALQPSYPVLEAPVSVALPAIPRALDLFPPANDGWRSATILVLSEPSYRGPVLVRGRQLDGANPVRFEVASGTQEELRLRDGTWDEAKPPLVVWGRNVHPEPGWRVAAAEVLMRSRGCYGVQVDGQAFSYTIPFFAIWQS